MKRCRCRVLVIDEDTAMPDSYLDLTCTLDGQLVFFRQLVHTQDGNNILERLVVLKDLLDGGGDRVMFLSNLFDA
jgi:hypothetical protein